MSLPYESSMTIEKCLETCSTRGYAFYVIIAFVKTKRQQAFIVLIPNVTCLPS